MAAVLQINFSIYFIQIKRAFNQMPLKLVPIGGGLIDNKSALIQVTWTNVDRYVWRHMVD